MSNNHNKISDEQLDEHMASLRDEAIPDGPSSQLVEATLMKIDLVTGRRTFIERLVAMSFPQKIAAAVLFTLGGLALYFMFMLFSSTSSIAFADVVEKLTFARTLAYTSTVTQPGKPPVSSRTLMAEPHRTRTEMGHDMVSINNGKTSLTLNLRSKTATKLEFSASPLTGSTPSIVDTFRNLGKPQGESLGEKKIDGIDAVGFRAINPESPLNGRPTMTVWADKKTSLPLRVEMAIPDGDAETLVVMDHFEIDPPLEDSLFSLEAPAGYVVTTQKLNLPTSFEPADTVAEFLRVYAKASGGSFPANLTDSQALTAMNQKSDKQTQMDYAIRQGAMYGTVISLPAGYGYAGKDVKLGEKDKIVFWYQPRSEKPGYKAVFGDLRIEEVTEDKLPSLPSTTQPADL